MTNLIPAWSASGHAGLPLPGPSQPPTTSHNLIWILRRKKLITERHRPRACEGVPTQRRPTPVVKNFRPYRSHFWRCKHHIDPVSVAWILQQPPQVTRQALARALRYLSKAECLKYLASSLLTTHHPPLFAWYGQSYTRKFWCCLCARLNVTLNLGHATNFCSDHWSVCFQWFSRVWRSDPCEVKPSSDLRAASE